MNNGTKHPILNYTCASCGSALQDKFCHACGEKQLDPHHDFSVRHFLEETFESFTHLDSRVIRSFKYLFIRPGFLTAEFVAGRRVRYMKPVPLFLVAGLLFYLFFPTTSAFFSNPADMNRGYEPHNLMSNTFHLDLPSLIEKKAAEKGMDAERFVQQTMADKASSKSKAWLFLLIPAWGIALGAMFWRKQKWLVPHLIFALHGLSFFILFDMLSLGIMSAFGYNSLGDGYVLYLMVAFIVYCILAVRAVHGLKWPHSIFSGFLASIPFFFLLALYRQLITFWTIWEA